MQTINQTFLRWVIALAAFLALFAGVATGAHAGTGGASSYTPSAPEGKEMTFGAWRYGHASWYGPGLWGNNTACGQVLRPQTMGVAHKTLPCGTAVKFVYGGRQIVTRVIDRGPYAKGFAWDLTNGTREALGFEGSGKIRYAVAAQYARH